MFAVVQEAAATDTKDNRRDEVTFCGEGAAQTAKLCVHALIQIRNTLAGIATSKDLKFSDSSFEPIVFLLATKRSTVFAQAHAACYQD